MKMTFSCPLKSKLLIATYFILSNLSIISANGGPKIFPRGAKSLFIGHSLFVPIAEQFDYFATQTGKFPDHDAQFFQSHGPTGLPSALWDDHKSEIENMLSSGDIELFGMTVSGLDEESKDAYKRWIDLALSYNPNTAIFIGTHWLTKPEDYEANNYTTTIKEDGDAAFEYHITTLREHYPNNNIYYLNYGMVAGEMKILFEENKLIHVDELIAETTDLRRSLFRDRIGHPGTMLQELTAITWLDWFYVGMPLDRMFANVKTEEIPLGWNTKNVGDVFRVMGAANEDYRLYDDSIITSLGLHNDFTTLQTKKIGLRGTSIA